MNSVLFSVVIPAYNRASIIRPTIESVLRQTCQDFEIIVVDDGSQDDLKAVLDTFSDSRIRYVHQENAGGGAARNTGIHAAQGKFVALLDSDDLFLPEKLEVFKKELPTNETVVLYSSMRVDRGVDSYWIRPSRGIRPGEDVGEYLFSANQLIQTSTIVLSTEFAKKVGFDPTLRRGQDLDFCVRLQSGGATFKFIDQPLTIWFDNTEAGRTSYVNGVRSSSDWLERAKPLLTNRAIRGYRSTVLVYHLVKVAPFKSLAYLVDGWLRGGVSFRTTLRQFLRAFVPRPYYRKLVNLFVSRFGREKFN